MNKQMNQPNKNIGYKMLADAIVLQAVKDYRTAVRIDSKSSKMEVLRFFRSDWFKTLTEIESETLISNLKQEVDNK